LAPMCDPPDLTTTAGRLQVARQQQWRAENPPWKEPAWVEDAVQAPTGLDPLQLSAQTNAYHCAEYLEPLPETDVGWRHSGWMPQRKRTYAALAAATGLPRRLDRFRRCGSDAWVMRAKNDHNRLAIQADHCHDRYCVPCMLARGRIVAANLRSRMGLHPHRLITLTVRGRRQPLTTILDHLYRGFTRLRRSTLWRDSVEGGVVVCEVTWSPNSQSWHPHLHVICSGRYIPKGVLSAAWLDATGDSYIVDLRLIRGRDDCVRYVTKYVSKPLSQTYAHVPDLLQEAIRALSGRRLCTTIGSWRGVPLYAITSDTEWEMVGRLSELRAQARNGDAYATAVIEMLRNTPTDYDVPPVLPGYDDT